MKKALLSLSFLFAILPNAGAATGSASLDAGSITVQSLIGGASYLPTDTSQLSFATIASGTWGGWTGIGVSSVFQGSGSSAFAGQSSVTASASTGTAYGHTWTWNLGTATVGANSVVLINLPYTFSVDATGQYDEFARANIRLLTRPSNWTASQGYSSTGSFQSDADFQASIGQSNSGSGILQLALINSSQSEKGFNIESGLWVQATANAPVTPVPEPETFVMMLAGLGLMGALARRRKSKQG